ncbi:hypothetical protein [Xanthomonas nasturtii]|uniref:Uncharacterized protein n=1 Tax=Xanthomonas nasturtii TaxID=1843581 RepID=A0ABT0LKG3_9XANT|nr:hypothetical protein [Xanthomonas nasturtii]MCL1549823.1 hypothetical protein [Xanthomonas nasturtii]
MLHLRETHRRWSAAINLRNTVRHVVAVQRNRKKIITTAAAARILQPHRIACENWLKYAKRNWADRGPTER